MKICVAEDVLSRIVDGEAVLLDLKSGTYFGLKGSGSTIWALIKASATVEQIESALVERFDVNPEIVTRDLDALLKQLRDRGLVELYE